MIALIKVITVWHSVMSWNDIASVAYSTEPSPGHCVIWHYSLTPTCHPTCTSTSLFSLTVNLHSDPLKMFFRETMFTQSTMDGLYKHQIIVMADGQTGVRGGDRDMQQEGGCSGQSKVLGVRWAHEWFGSRAVDTMWPCRDRQTGGHFCSITTG